jgi:hypothetical protein
VGWTAGVRFPAGIRGFYLIRNVQSGSVANQASCPIGTGSTFTGGKADHSPPSSSEFKYGGAMSSWKKRVNCPCAKLNKRYAMKAYEGVDILIHIFLTSALVGGEWSASRPCRFSPGKELPVPIL